MLENRYGTGKKYDSKWKEAMFVLHTDSLTDRLQICTKIEKLDDNNNRGK